MGRRVDNLHFDSLFFVYFILFSLKSLSFPHGESHFWDKEQGWAPPLSIHDPLPTKKTKPRLGLKHFTARRRGL